jgi:hypothetical protein
MTCVSPPQRTSVLGRDVGLELRERAASPAKRRAASSRRARVRTARPPAKPAASTIKLAALRQHPGAEAAPPRQLGPGPVARQDRFQPVFKCRQHGGHQVRRLAARQEDHVRQIETGH